MNLSRFIRIYFENIPADSWSYSSFISHMTGLGYGNKKDYILKNYVRILNEFKRNDEDDFKRIMPGNLLKELDNNILYHVSVAYIIYFIFFIKGDNDDI